MVTDTPQPQSLRAKIVFFVWSNLPRFALLCLIALIFILSGVITKESASIKEKKMSTVSQEKPVINVVTLTLKPTSISDQMNLPGFLEPWTTLPLLANITGRVSEVLVREGQEVTKGDIIAKIEQDDYRIAFDRAHAAHTLAMAEYTRDKKVYAKGMLPTADIEVKQASMETAKADLATAKLLLNRCIITSPMDGVIRSLDAKPGLLLSVGDPVAEIIQIDRLKAVVGIPESDVNAVNKLQTVAITIQALANKKITAKKYFLSPSPDNSARLYDLELTVNNADRTIFAGMFIRAEIVKQRLSNTICIPFYSVISRNKEQFVFVENGGTAQKKIVTLGIMEKWMVQVTSGLQSGDKLLIEGHRSVEDGQKVKVVKNMDIPGDRPR